MSCTNIGPKSSLKYLGSLSALFAMSGAADAAIVQSSTVGGGLTPPASNGHSFWDVDNDGTNDFSLINYASYAGLLLSAVSGNHGVGLSAELFAWAALGSAFTVGPTLKTDYVFKAASQAIYGAFTISSGIFPYAAPAGFAIDTTSYIGFRFDISGATHYGWAILTPTAGPEGQGFTISEAYYEDVADTSIQTGAVPEPETTAMGLAALALGAAGVRRWRKAKAA